MHVERKSSSWPYITMLAGLLAACLLAPSYWRKRCESEAPSGNRIVNFRPQTAHTPKSSITAERFTARRLSKDVPYLLPGSSALDLIATSGLVPNLQTWPQIAGVNNLGAYSAPTLDELIAALHKQPTSGISVPLISASPAPMDFYEFTMWPSSPAAAVSFDVDPDAAVAVPGPWATAGLRWAGATISEFAPRLMGGWLGKSIVHFWVASSNRPEIFDTHIGQLLPNDLNGVAAETADPISVDVSANEQVSTRPWGVPEALYDQLARLAQHPYSAYWANETISHLHALMQVQRFQGDETTAILAALQRSAATANQLADQSGDDRMRVDLLRAHWALARRLDCWTAINDIRVASVANARIASRESFSGLLHDVPQRNDLEFLSAHLEAYERSRDPSDAYRVSQLGRELATSPDPMDRELADSMEQHYRNANVRVAITAEMLNRFVPEQQTEAQPVWDRIAGTPVRGQSETMTSSRLQLEPATGRWQMNLESRGTVESDTVSNGGPARLRSFGATEFTVRKSVVVEPDGVRMQSAVVSTENFNHLAGVTTDYDWIPLLGAYARGRAVDQYRAKRQRAKAEVECKVATQVGNRLDERATETVDRIEHDIRTRFTDPLAGAGVELTPIELLTTSDRLVARFRVAGLAQLGAHTPRPRALSDSLASAQVHETALTNAAVALGLDGKRLSAHELQAMLREKFPGLASASPPETREDTSFQFADRGAVQFRIGGGRFEIAVLVNDFQQDSRRIRNFIVHAYYVPVVDGLSAELARDGALGIEGRLTATDRARLYSVFNEVLGAERRLPILRLTDPADPRLTGLMITQLVLEDGWLGLAIGPHSGGRLAERARSLR